MLNGREIATLPPMEVADRLPRLAARLGDLGCDGLHVTKLTNIRYLTGFTGSAGLLVVLPDESLLVSDGRYRNQSAEQVKASGVPVWIEIGRPAAQLDSIERVAKGLPRLGLEADDITWGAQQRLGRVLGQHTKLSAVANAVESLRMVKDEGELARIQATGLPLVGLIVWTRLPGRVGASCPRSWPGAPPVPATLTVRLTTRSGSALTAGRPL